MNKNTKIALGVIGGLLIAGLIVRKIRKRNSAKLLVAKISKEDTSQKDLTPSQQDNSALVMNPNIEFNNPFDKELGYNPNFGMVMPIPVPEMSPNNQAIDLTF